MPQNGVHLNGKAIEEARESLLLTQEKLAALADIHPKTLGRMEADPTYRASFKTIRKVARKLKKDPAQFVRASEEATA